MSDNIKPIETVYKGYRFRSRLEARWAVFFDAMEIEWEYEVEGYSLEGDFEGDTLYYLPDFKLGNIYVEVKPDDDLSPDEFAKIYRFSKTHPIVLVCGLPKAVFYDVSGDHYGGICFMYHKGEKGNFEIGNVGEEAYSGLWKGGYLLGNKIELACNEAKSARFEFGEKG